MWPHDTAEAEWLAVGVQPHKADTTPKTEKAAALTATVKNMSDIAIPAPANSNAPTQRGGVLRRIINGLRAWQERLDARDTLHSMSDRELADIGLTRGDIDYVTAKRASTSPGHRAATGHQRLDGSRRHGWCAHGPGPWRHAVGQRCLRPQ